MADLQSAMEKARPSIVTGKKGEAQESNDVDISTLPSMEGEKPRRENRRPERKTETPREERVRPNVPRPNSLTVLSGTMEEAAKALREFGTEKGYLPVSLGFGKLSLSLKKGRDGKPWVTCWSADGDFFAKKFGEFTKGEGRYPVEVRFDWIEDRVHHPKDDPKFSPEGVIGNHNGRPVPETEVVRRRDFAWALAAEVRKIQHSKERKETLATVAGNEGVMNILKSRPERKRSATPAEVKKVKVHKKPERTEKPKRFQVPEGFDRPLPRIIATGTEKDVRDRLEFLGGKGKGLLFDLNDIPGEVSTFSFEVLMSDNEIRVIGLEAEGRFVDCCADVDDPETKLDALRRVIDGNEEGADAFALVLGLELRKVFRKDVVTPVAEVASTDEGAADNGVAPSGDAAEGNTGEVAE